MRFKLKLTNTSVKRLDEKVKLFRITGNGKGIDKIRAVLLVSNDESRGKVAKILGITTETLRLWIRDFFYLGLRLSLAV